MLTKEQILAISDGKRIRRCPGYITNARFIAPFDGEFEDSLPIDREMIDDILHSKTSVDLALDAIQEAHVSPGPIIREVCQRCQGTGTCTCYNCEQEMTCDECKGERGFKRRDPIGKPGRRVYKRSDGTFVGCSDMLGSHGWTVQGLSGRSKYGTPLSNTMKTGFLWRQ